MYKLLGFDYSVEYKSRKENVVSDGLSRLFEEESIEKEGSIFPLSRPINALLEGQKLECCNSTLLEEKTRRLESKGGPKSDLITTNNLLYFHERLMFKKDTKHKVDILKEFHNSMFGGHSRVEHTKKDTIDSMVERYDY